MNNEKKNRICESSCRLDADASGNGLRIQVFGSDKTWISTEIFAWAYRRIRDLQLYQRSRLFSLYERKRSHNEIHEYEEGSTYKIDSKEFEGYDLVEEKLPENSEGIVGIDPIEVTYYYIRKASVVVEHLDITTGEKLAENQRIVGHEGDSYKTEAKNIKDYELAQVPENKEGTMIITEDNEGNIITEIVVKYYYKQAEKQLAKVVEKHVDIETNKLIETETVYNGVEGDKYKTSSKTFEGYELVKDRLPQNAEGTMTAGVTEVVYYYSKKQSDIETPKEKVTIRVEHLEVGTGKKLAEDDVIVGEEGQNYTTNSKNISGFTL